MISILKMHQKRKGEGTKFSFHPQFRQFFRQEISQFSNVKCKNCSVEIKICVCTCFLMDEDETIAVTSLKGTHKRNQKPLLKKVGLNKQVINFALICGSTSQIKSLINFCFRNESEKNIDRQNNYGRG